MSNMCKGYTIYITRHTNADVNAFRPGHTYTCQTRRDQAMQETGCHMRMTTSSSENLHKRQKINLPLTYDVPGILVTLRETFVVRCWLFRTLSCELSLYS